MAANSTLYPPVINYAMPAFASTADSVRIYFSLSSYNSISEINGVHMTVRYQESNENALIGGENGYQSRIKAFNTFFVDDTRVTQADKYYVELNANDLVKGFQIDTIYKVQLRFSKQPTEGNDKAPSTAWLNANSLAFSEWSTVCLLKPIAVPECTILGLEGADTGATVNYTSADAAFAIIYSQGESNELLKSWRTILYNEEKTKILADSDWKNYTNYDYLAPNESNVVTFESVLPYTMISGAKYVLQLSILTRNGYSKVSNYVFNCYPLLTNDFEGEIDANINEEEGYTSIHITSDIAYSTNIVLRRTSSETNYQIWEDVGVKTVLDEQLNWFIRDYTIESGIYYIYGVQTRDTSGRRGSLKVKTNKIMGEFENAFLLESDGKQLKLKYDFDISSANITVSENKTDTIGSKFPFVRRNGTMYYRTFQCSGLITGFMDVNENLFTSPTELYHGAQQDYQNYRNEVTQQFEQYDYTYEREFREKVQEFLYNDKIKLFKSLQEGNILVKLMNISLTPKKELGRLLYTFSAQAIEIDEPKLSVLQSYGIQHIDRYASEITFQSSHISQVSNFEGYNKEDQEDNEGNTITISTPINIKYKANTTNIVQEVGRSLGWEYNGSNIQKHARNNIVVEDFNLNYLKIEFEDDPYLIIKYGNNDLLPLSAYTGALDTSEILANYDLILGWLININGTIILVQPPNDTYEIDIANFALNANAQVTFPVDTLANISYTVSLNEAYDTASNVPISLRYEVKVGQINRFFDPISQADDVLSVLERKYAFTDATGKTRKIYSLHQLTWAEIEAEPGTILYARSNMATEPTQFVINENGLLFLEPNINNSKIEVLKFAGKQVDVRYLNPVYLETNQWDYWDNTDNQVTAAIELFNTKHDRGTIKKYHAQPYDYYKDENSDQYYMYYNREWYPATPAIDSENLDNNYIWEIQCPVMALVNYEIQQLEGTYQ